MRTGEFFGILGPNGAGKTSTLEIVEGLRRPDAGAVRLLGRPSRPRDPLLLPRVGVQLQASAFFERLTAREQIRTFAGPAPALASACALVHEPEVVFLDEPTAALDRQARRNLLVDGGPLLVSGTLSSMSLGLLAGALAKTQEGAVNLANFFVLPMAFLSGSFFPLDGAPSWLRVVSSLLPLRHLNDGMLDVMVRGRGPAAALPPMGILLSLALALVSAVLLAVPPFRTLVGDASSIRIWVFSFRRPLLAGRLVRGRRPRGGLLRGPCAGLLGPVRALIAGSPHRLRGRAAHSGP